MEARLLAQIAAAAAAGQGFVIPGNHDWGRSEKDGWEAVLREGAFVAERGAPNVRFVPEGGCPGPVVLGVSPTVRLVVFDSHWFLHEWDKPQGAASKCAEKSEADVVATFRGALRPVPGVRTVVLSHHPLESGGRSGSHFGWRDHFFPMTHLRSWLWLPLPGLGSLSVGGRVLFASPQQMASASYRHMMEALKRALDPAPPFIWAAGHDHNLQVIHGAPGGPRWILVSGAGGGPEYVNPVQAIPGILFARSAPGYMRIAFDAGGRVRLSVVGTSPPGTPEVLFAADLD
jgi:hypothetical protein